MVSKACLVALVVVLALTLGAANVLPSRAQGLDFVTVSGTSLLYRGQPINLRGENFNNGSALGASIGSGNIANINVSEADYAQLESMGANHVRFAMSFGWYAADRNTFFQVLDQHVAWAKAHHLWLIPSMFTTPADCWQGYNHYCSLWTNPGEQTALVNFWVDFATHYRNEPTIVGFDLLNEPTPPGPGWSQTWFILAQRIHDAVYAVDPNHLTFIEAGSDQRFLYRLNGNNIVYEVVSYSPLSLTHAWDSSAGSYPGYAAAWDGTPVYWDKNAMLGNGSKYADLRQNLSLNWTQQNNVPLYVAEWGTRNHYSGYLQYMQDIFSIFNSWPINYAHFVWRSVPGDFGLYPWQGGSFVFNDPAMEAVLRAGWTGAVHPGSDFYRAINLGGPALAIDGQSWDADSASNFGTNGTTITCNPWVTLNPGADAARAQMVTCGRMGWSMSLTMTAVPNGIYTVYLYTFEDWAPRTYNITLQGQVVQANYDSGSAGTWRKLGPWTAYVTDGTLTLSTCCGSAILSGLEVWRTPVAGAANASAPSTAPTFVPPTP